MLIPMLDLFVILNLFWLCISDLMYTQKNKNTSFKTMKKKSQIKEKFRTGAAR